MNPHFIFNALNSVNSYIAKSDEKSANKYLSDFSKLMRLVMENSKYDFVSLDTEVNTLELYLSLEHFRFKEKFDYTFNIGADIATDTFEIPPMFIQPYIENAIWHGLRYKEAKGFLNVIFEKDNQNLKVTVEDNGIGRKESKKLKTKFQKENVSTGLKNIENRVDIINKIYKTKISIDIKDFDIEKQSGTIVTMIIPPISQ